MASVRDVRRIQAITSSMICGPFGFVVEFVAQAG